MHEPKTESREQARKLASLRHLREVVRCVDFSGGMSPRTVRVVAVLACLLALLLCPLPSAAAAQEDGEEALPHVFVSILARNSAHLLPNFFGYLEQLDYPKDRISVW